MFWRKRKNKFEVKQEEPLFAAVNSKSETVLSAHAKAAATLPEFMEHVQRVGEHICSAKLRFKDPTESERTGKDVMLFLWLTSVTYDKESGTYAGTFFEVPPELSPWHHAGQRLRFDPEDIFDWMVNEDGLVHGAFTLRVTRASLPEAEREPFDKYIGAKSWAQPDKQ